MVLLLCYWCGGGGTDNTEEREKKMMMNTMCASVSERNEIARMMIMRFVCMHVLWEEALKKASIMAIKYY